MCESCDLSCNCKKLAETFRGYDWFGHPIALNFNREGDTHNTSIGGFFSIFLRIAIFFYFCMNFNKFWFKLDDTEIMTVEENEEVEIETL